MNPHDTSSNPKDLTVLISELLVATADASDAAIDRAVPEVLRLLREKLHMDVVFVSEFINGQRVFRFVNSAAGAPHISAGDSNPLEESYCQRVVDGRLPELVTDAATLPASYNLPKTSFRVGAHLSTPIVLPDGRIYGTLCCFSLNPNEHLQRRDLENLRKSAQLVAHKVNAALQQNKPFADTDWAPLPLEERWNKPK